MLWVIFVFLYMRLNSFSINFKKQRICRIFEIVHVGCVRHYCQAKISVQIEVSNCCKWQNNFSERKFKKYLFKYSFLYCKIEKLIQTLLQDMTPTLLPSAKISICMPQGCYRLERKLSYHTVFLEYLNIKDFAMWSVNEGLAENPVFINELHSIYF